jgi:uncharacterized damage-inducible protein DinB
MEGVPAMLMPAAHAFVQTLEDVESATSELSSDQMWVQPNGAASVGFHIMHLAGSTDRLLTYARGERLSQEQRDALRAEEQPAAVPAGELIAYLRRAIDRALEQLRATPESALAAPRTVGRAALPTTVIGLLFHAAEHSQRHAGQIVTTAKIVRGQF